MFKPLRKVVRKLGQQQNPGLSPSKTPAGHSAQTFEQSLPISTDIRENERYFKQVIGESPDLNVHKFQFRLQEKKVEEALLVYISGLEDADSIHENVLDPLRKYADHPGADQPILAELRARKRRTAGSSVACSGGWGY